MISHRREAIVLRSTRLLGYLFLSTICFVENLSAQKPFTDITSQSGIQHQFIVYEGMFGGGACVLDIDKDGFEDIYITGGMSDDVLYLNQKNGTFKNIFESSGMTLTKHFVTQGVVGADVNKDGWTDLYITTLTSRDSVKIIPRAINLLFINNGNNTFRDVTKEYRLDQLNSFSTGANFGDINADGYPDLYVGNYFQDYQGQLTTINDATIVNASRTAKGYLLINHKGKYFKDEYEKYGMNHKGFGFGGVFTDYDNDGDQDIFINQDFGYKAIPDYLYQNQYPIKSFIDVSEASNMDLKINSMGTAVGDYDNDGDMDYYVTNIRFNYFMVNSASEGPAKPFQNKAKELGMSYVMISWGANFADFDHDGDVDLFVANGDLNPNCVPMADFYFQNDTGRFREVARFKGLNDYGIGRGSVVFDIENDGDLDLLVVNQKPILNYPVSSFTSLYRNDSVQGNWFKVQLVGTQSETNGIGAKVAIVIGKLRMLREIDGGGSSHISQNSTIAHFGVGKAAEIDTIHVTWPGGIKQTIIKQSTNQLLRITEPIVKTRSSNRYYWILIIIALLSIFKYLKHKTQKPE